MSAPTESQRRGARLAIGEMNVNFVAHSLGDPAKSYPVQLTEPEINALYALIEFVRSECVTLAELAGHGYRCRFWEHYGPTGQALSDRLSVAFDNPSDVEPPE